jgi:Arc/MetJ-type ribon-helix-helix transcriptional regulator
MTIELNPKQEQLLQDAIQQGRFRSVDEALDEALRSIARPAAATGRYTPAEAAERIRELRKGHFLPEGMTIRSLLDEGRR